MTAYYNEKDRNAAAWLRELIAEGHIAHGVVDERSIVDVRPADLDGFVQCHFFAGISGWSLALRLAGWNDDRHVWTGSCPCQPFSTAGQRKGLADERHLWPEFKRLIAERCPSVVFGEQVASATDWLRLVRGDLEAMEYAVGAMPIEAASAGADHRRDRFWFVADSRHGAGAAGESGPCGAAQSPGQEDTNSIERNRFMANAKREQCAGQRLPAPSQWIRDADAFGGDGRSQFSWVRGADGKERRIKPGVRLLANGFPHRVGLLRGFGNAIDPRPAAAFIKAASEVIRAR